MVLNIITLIAAAFFSGAAVYISLVEHPARISLDSKNMLQEWKFGIKRATIMQGSLALFTFLLACISYVLTTNLFWLIGGTTMLINWPFTLLLIMPINKILISTSIDAASDKTDYLIKLWNRLHIVRTILGIISTTLFGFALSC